MKEYCSSKENSKQKLGNVNSTIYKKERTSTKKSRAKIILMTERLKALPQRAEKGKDF